LDLFKVFKIRTNLDRIGLIYAIAFAFLLSAFGCRTTDAGSPAPSGTPAREILRVATSGDYLPFSDWPVAAPAPRGFSVSVAEAYAHDRDASLEWIRFRWPELASDLRADAFDLALSGITVRPDRSMLGRFGLPLTISGALVLVPAESSLASASDLDRPSLRIAVNAGGHLERVTRRLFPSARVEAIADNTRILDHLEQGAADAVVSDSLEAPHWQRNSRIRLRTIGPLTRDRKAAWFPPENEREARRFDRWLLRAESTGRLDRLRREHGLPETRTALALPALLASLDERLSLMRAVANAKHILDAPIANLAREEVVLDAALRAIQETALEPEVESDTETIPLDPGAVRRLFRAQIEAAKWIQNQHLLNGQTEGNPANPAERLAAQTTLDEVIRPALLYLGRRITWLLVACAAEAPKNLSYDDVAYALGRHQLPESHLRALYDPLSTLVNRE